MASLMVVEGAEDDLDLLATTHVEDVGLIDALIEELMDSNEFLKGMADEVPTWYYLFKPPFELKKFEVCWRQRMRVYILKIYDETGHLIDFRVFVGHDPRIDKFYILSVQPRATCYDTTKQEFIDLCDRYSAARIPYLPGS
jgi:hypothetical protein